jgi:hypothetical protein
MYAFTHERVQNTKNHAHSHTHTYIEIHILTCSASKHSSLEAISHRHSPATRFPEFPAGHPRKPCATTGSHYRAYTCYNVDFVMWRQALRRESLFESESESESESEILSAVSDLSLPDSGICAADAFVVCGHVDARLYQRRLHS